MKFNLKRPCKDCPFRKDIMPYLTAGRVRQILDAILREDKSFTCHKTISGTRSAEDEDIEHYEPGEADQHCAGALLMEKAAGWPNLVPRMAIFLNMFDPAALTGDELVFESEEAMIDAML